MYDIKVLNNKCKMGGGDDTLVHNVGMLCFKKIISAYIVYDSNII
jgi:hypothetical protein